MLVRLLSEPEYEVDAAWSLFFLARTDQPQPQVWPRNWPTRDKDFNNVWNARAGEAEASFVEPLRTELAGVLRSHIEGILAARSVAEPPTDFNHRLRELAVVLAELDGKASSELVLDILNLPETGRWLYGGWPRVHSLEGLLMNGVVLPSAKTWEILEPVIQHVRAHRWDSQQSGLLTHALCVALFTDDPSGAVAKVKELVKENLLSAEGIRALTKTLGFSRCDDVLVLLRELVEDTTRAGYLGDTWIDAVARFDTNEGRNLLLSFVDPSLPALPTELVGRYDDRLVTRLAEMARRHPDVQRRLLALVRSELSQRSATLLGKVLADLGSDEAILAALDLLSDDGTGGVISYQLHKRLEAAFVEHRPYPGASNTFTVVPQSSNVIRARLLDVVRNDAKRRKSAYALLSEVEKLRMWHGRPNGEPRSPALADGSMWPLEAAAT